MDQDAMYIDIGRANYTKKELLLEEASAGGDGTEEEGRGGGQAEGDEEEGDGYAVCIYTYIGVNDVVYTERRCGTTGVEWGPRCCRLKGCINGRVMTIIVVVSCCWCWFGCC